MRRWRSFLATTISAPSSIFLRPIFQVSAARSENCSIASPSVVGTISTAIWLPFLASNDRKVWFSVATSPLLSVPVWSTTRPTSGGTATLAKAGARKGKTQPSNSASRMALAAFMAVKSWCSNLLIGYFDGAGVGLKSTFGAVEMAFSFSTEKLGFSL